MKLRLAAVASLASLSLVACVPTNGDHTPSPTVPAPSTPTGAAEAATALVRAGAREATPVASAPITAEGELQGGTFHVYSVRATGTSTRLDYVITHPSAKTASGILDDRVRSPWLPTLKAGEVTYSMTQYQMASGVWAPVAANQYELRPDPSPLFGSYGPLPATVTEVEVATPLIDAPLTIPVDRVAETPPSGSADVPVLGRAVYRDQFDAGHADPLILSLHGVRRLDNATALYYSAVFPEGVTPVRLTWWGGGSNVLNQRFAGSFPFTKNFGLLDRAAMKGYSQLGPTTFDYGCTYDALGPAVAGDQLAHLCWALLPALDPATQQVDVVLGGKALLQDVPVSSGAMTPVSTEEAPALGTGWPEIPADRLAKVTADLATLSTGDLRNVAKEGAITSSGEQLDLDSTVLFDYNQATLTPGAQAVLTATAEKIKAAGRSGTVSVTGHTDSDGSDLANLDLSKRRARAVADALAPLLGSGYTFTVDGKGEAEPAMPNETETGKAANRRVTVLPPQ
ncbi:MAG: OmpA family protein [Propioniciclava sp.]|uniref:OmpA family protein n=1 Tax=Propioniciclava sp. TaxID=2038686 RepID=UPI0039E32B1D